MRSALSWFVLWQTLAYSIAADEVSDAGQSVPVCDASTFLQGVRSHVAKSGIEIVSLTATTQNDYTSIEGGPLQPSLTGLGFCQVKVHITHQGTNDKVLVEAWLPLTHDEWNGRFQATGGAGFETGMFGGHLGEAIRDGWAAV